MKLIVRSPNWLLFKEDENLFINARVCCGMVDQSVTVMLTSKQKRHYSADGAAYLDVLSDELAGKYGYDLRHGNFEKINNLISDEIRVKISQASAKS